MVNIREFSADELRSVIEQSIELLSQEEIVVPAEPAKEEEWQKKTVISLLLSQRTICGTCTLV